MCQKNFAGFFKHLKCFFKVRKKVIWDIGRILDVGIFLKYLINIEFLNPQSLLGHLRVIILLIINFLTFNYST